MKHVRYNKGLENFLPCLIHFLLFGLMSLDYLLSETFSKTRTSLSTSSWLDQIIQ